LIQVASALEQRRNAVSEGFTTERKNLGRAITMQILRFEISDLPDCPAEKGGMILAKDCNMIHCNMICV
jgi:hypothetical protein